MHVCQPPTLPMFPDRDIVSFPEEVSACEANGRSSGSVSGILPKFLDDYGTRTFGDVAMCTLTCGYPTMTTSFGRWLVVLLSFDAYCASVIELEGTRRL